jgi:hypothetical protein
MYMGGIKSFQKNGRGIMIHDDGTSMITSYMNDFRHGHNIYYKTHCVVSVEFGKNKIRECVIRVPEYLLLIRYNKDDRPHGKAVLVVYGTRSIYYVVFRAGGILEKKEEKDPDVINQIF